MGERNGGGQMGERDGWGQMGERIGEGQIRAIQFLTVWASKQVQLRNQAQSNKYRELQII